MKISISTNTQSELENEIDNLKRELSYINKQLKIRVNGMIREWTATCTSLKFNRQSYNVNWVGNVEIQFSCQNPRAYSENIISLKYEGVSGDDVEEFDYTGGIDTTPDVYIIFQTASSVNGLTITVNGYPIQITQSITAGAIITFKGDEKKVLLNNSEINYVGVFPQLTNGSNRFEFTFNSGASATYDFIITYYNLYL